MYIQDVGKFTARLLGCEKKQLNKAFIKYLENILNIVVGYHARDLVGRGAISFEEAFVAKCIVDWELITGGKVVE